MVLVWQEYTIQTGTSVQIHTDSNKPKKMQFPDGSQPGPAKTAVFTKTLQSLQEAQLPQRNSA